jgi:predicted RND superfamily exporter protein
MTSVIDFLLKARGVSIGAVGLLLVVLVILGKPVHYEQSVRSFFADDDPAIIDYAKASAAFGDDNLVFVSYEDAGLLTPGGMDRVAELAREIGPRGVKGVSRVESIDAMPLLWRVDDGLIAMDAMPGFARNLALGTMRKAIKNVDMTGNNSLAVGGFVRTADSKGLADLKARLTRHPLFLGTLIDAEAKTTALVVRLINNETSTLQDGVIELRKKADAFAQRHKLGRPAIVGPPVLLADGFTSIDVDGRRLAIVGMVLIGLVTLSATQNLWWSLVPLMAGWTVWLSTEWVLATFDMKLSLSGGPLVAQIIVLTMPAASHLAIHFRDERRREGNARVAARSTLAAVSSPILWCAVTGAIGYGALVTSTVVPIQQFGWIMGLCTLLAALLVMAISPAAMLPPFPMGIPIKHGSTSRTARGMERVTEWVYGHPTRVVVALVAIVVPLAAGMSRLSYETNFINAFKPESRVVKDYATVESRLGGIGLVEVLVPASGPVGPATLAKCRSVERGLLGGKPGGPKASLVLSLATILDPDGRIEKLPEASAARVLAAKLDLISASPQAELLRGFLNPEARQARIIVRLVEQQPAPDKSAIFADATRLARQAFGESSYLTGLSYLMTKTTEGVIKTQWTTFFWSVLGILIMLTVALRGPLLAALAILPTLLSVSFVLGLMGWLGIKLDMATALVASVALGLSVDDTFHCLLQYRRQRATQPFRDSLFASYLVTGPGVLLSSSAVAVGFLALRLSEFVPFSNFGAMVAIATAGSTVGNILLLPACLTLGDRLKTSRAQPAVAGASKS